MPCEWVKPLREALAQTGAFSHAAGAPPCAVLHLWPYRSLPRKGFVTFFAITFALVLMPLLAVIGSPVLWGLLPFVMGALGLTWLLLQRSYRDGEILEELRLWPDRVELTRQNPRGPLDRWHANLHWVTAQLHRTGGPVPNYVTLRGGRREVEIGAFLSEEERIALYEALRETLTRLRQVSAPLLHP